MLQDLYSTVTLLQILYSVRSLELPDKAKGFALWCLIVINSLQYYFGCKPGDVYACVADIGWITGHSYVVYGPLCNGVTSVLFESSVGSHLFSGDYHDRSVVA